MLFLFKEKPIEITAIVPPDYSLALEITPIKLARECFPSWWKNTPSSKFNWDIFNSDKTVKSCPGIGLSLQRGFILQQWSDLAIETKGDEWRWNYSDVRSRVNYHGSTQAPGFYSDHHIFKISSPWRIITPVDIFVQFPLYMFENPPPYVTPGGFIPPIKNTCSSNIFLMIKKSEQVLQHIIKQGTPLLQIIPFTDKKVKLKCEVVSNDEYAKFNNYVSSSNFFASKGLKSLHELNKK